MSASLPPDLRVLCRKLTSIPPAQLPHALPSLINHVLHCKEPLSAAHEQRPKDKSTEASQLVHKLKASITTLLNGRNRDARFAAIGLIKATVDVGGWEVLRGTEPWVRGLLSVIQVCVEAFPKYLSEANNWLESRSYSLQGACYCDVD